MMKNVAEVTVVWWGQRDLEHVLKVNFEVVQTG